jgi:outer membrane protein
MEIFMKRLIYIVCFLLFASVAFAQVKIGVVDMSRCIFGSDAGKAANEELKAFETELATKLKLKELTDEYKKVTTEYTEQEKLLTDAIKRTKLEAIQKKAAELENLNRTYTAELQKKDRDLLNKIQTEIIKVVNEVAVEEKYTYVLEKQAVVYTVNSFDITEQVLERFNKKGK